MRSFWLSLRKGFLSGLGAIFATLLGSKLNLGIASRESDAGGVCSSKWSFYGGGKMKHRIWAYVPAFLVLLVFSAPALRAEWDPASDPELVKSAQDTVKAFKASDPKLGAYFKEAYGYVVFPTIGKGGFIIGGGGGKGVVFEKGRITGMAKVVKITIGAQVGGEAYSELMFFKDKATCEKFKSGGAKFQANATATAGDASRQAATNWADGVAVFFKGKGGLIADASMGTQDFTFDPAPPPPAKKKGKKG
jgi:lipid-binding SYLF domain-containing protein